MTTFHLPLLFLSLLLCSSLTSSSIVPVDDDDDYDSVQSVDITAAPLELEELSKYNVKGKYFDMNTGEGIQFQTKPDGSMSITTVSGRLMIKLSGIFYTMGPTGKMHNNLVEMGGKSFLRQSDEVVDGDYYLSISQANVIKSALASKDEVASQDAVITVLQGLVETAIDYHKDAVSESISDLLKDSHYPLINEAVHYMGETMGLTGLDYPSLLPLYLMAMKLEELSDNTNSMWWKKKKKYPSNLQCLKTCKPCKSYNCLGLCGRKCSCWKWVCGDCCYHYICFNHDLDCINCGQYSFRCIFGVPKPPFDCKNKTKPKIRKSC
uniref:Uncharacterized protein n=1 Tax=Amphimedon queenslandica TaxID=400682 RepID=A0A1X7UJ80_AMPQE